MTAVRQTMRGIAAMVASQLVFLLNDTFTKLASDALPMGQIIFLRGLFCAFLVGTAAAVTGAYAGLPLLRHRSVFWRLLAELGGTFFFLLALINMPIANATIIFQAVPLTATIAAYILLGEPVGWRRWMAVVIGFLGVLLVIRPGLSGFDAYGLVVLISVVFIALRDICTRTMPAEIPTLLLTGATALAVAAMGLAMGIAEDWVTPTPLQYGQLAGAGLFLALGYFTVIAALRLGHVSVTAPFRYVAVVFAIGVGFLVWGDVPDRLTLLGTAVIVGTGLYALFRERKVAGVAPATLSASAPMQG